MPIQEINTYSLDEFWETISPIGEFINRMELPFFRGQGDAVWPLTPSVLREDKIKDYYSNSKYSQTDFIFHVEYLLIFNFISNCDKMVLTIPSDTEEFRSIIDFDNFISRYGKNGLGWPPKELYPVLALAQHHSIPTRLLDWTRDSKVAAYFAGSQALNNLTTKSDSICVWVIDSKKLYLLNGILEIVTVPGSTSKNLAAQKGELIVHKEANGVDRNTQLNWSKYKDAINNIIEESKEFMAYKVTLPATLAGELMLRCDKFGYSAATLFPGFDGAAKAALEFQLAKKQSDRL